MILDRKDRRHKEKLLARDWAYCHSEVPRHEIQLLSFMIKLVFIFHFIMPSQVIFRLSSMPTTCLRSAKFGKWRNFLRAKDNGVFFVNPLQCRMAAKPAPFRYVVESMNTHNFWALKMLFIEFLNLGRTELLKYLHCLSILIWINIKIIKLEIQKHLNSSRSTSSPTPI